MKSGFHRQMHRALLAVGFSVIVAAYIAGCERAPTSAISGAASQKTPTVEVALRPAVIGSAERSIEVVGTLFGDEEATISAKVAGQVVAVLKDVGDAAEAGEPLAYIDPVAYKLLRDQAKMALEQGLSVLGLDAVPAGDVDLTTVPTVVQKRIQYENAQRRFERAAQLFTGGAAGSISEQEYTDLKAAADVARSEYDVQLLTVQSQLAEVRVRDAELRIRQQRLDDTTVRAPGGVGPTTLASGDPAPKPFTQTYLVAMRQVSLGEYVREGTPLFRLVSDDPIKLRAGVPERYQPRVRVGQVVRATIEGQAKPFDGRVSRVNPQVDPASRTFQVEAVFANPDGALRPGQFARAAVIIGQDSGVTFVPAEAVVSFAGVVRVFTVQDGKAVEHRITPGATVNGLVEILDGFAGPGEVVVRGGSRLANGVPVKVVHAAASAPPTGGE